MPPHLTTGSRRHPLLPLCQHYQGPQRHSYSAFNILAPNSLTSSSLSSTHLILPLPEPEPGARWQQLCYLQSLFQPSPSITSTIYFSSTLFNTLTPTILWPHQDFQSTDLLLTVHHSPCLHALYMYLRFYGPWLQSLPSNYPPILLPSLPLMYSPSKTQPSWKPNSLPTLHCTQKAQCGRDKHATMLSDLSLIYDHFNWALAVPGNLITCPKFISFSLVRKTISTLFCLPSILQPFPQLGAFCFVLLTISLSLGQLFSVITFSFHCGSGTTQKKTSFSPFSHQKTY